MFQAALIRQGLTNPLRAEDKPGQDINILELGTVHIPLQQAAVLSVDPYAQVKDGLDYPAVLLTGSVTDTHEPIWQTAKLAARLQAASISGRPVLLRVALRRGAGRADAGATRCGGGGRAVVPAVAGGGPRISAGGGAWGGGEEGAA